MNQILLALVLVIAFGVTVGQLVRTLRGDGYGHRPPPRSHWEEVDAHHPYHRLVG